MRQLNPQAIHDPIGTYSQAIEVGPNARWLVISGQVGIDPDGKTLDGVAAQSEQAWRNLVAILEAAGMTVQNLVKITSLVTRAEDFATYAKVRASFLQDCRPASTSFVASALARPELLVEVEAMNGTF